MFGTLWIWPSAKECFHFRSFFTVDYNAMCISLENKTVPQTTRVPAFVSFISRRDGWESRDACSELLRHDHLLVPHACVQTICLGNECMDGIALIFPLLSAGEEETAQQQSTRAETRGRPRQSQAKEQKCGRGRDGRGRRGPGVVIAAQIAWGSLFQSRR